MASRNRLIAYIALNVLVSALVTTTILLIYHHFFRPEPIPAVGTGSLDITDVFGAGQVAGEIVVVHNPGPASANLSGWKLQSPDGEAVYEFPQVTLHPKGTIRVHTMSGSDTAIDLFWNLSRSVWRSGDLVTLVDSVGNVVDNYRIP